LITSSYPLSDWWRFLVEHARNGLRWIETVYKDHAGVITLGGILLTVVGLIPRIKKRADLDRHRAAISRLLRGSLLDEVEQRAAVGHGLREAIRIDLNLTAAPAAVPIDLRIVAGSRWDGNGARSAGDAIQHIFKRTGGRLLILGDPGTGKTNLLLELAASLIRNARDDADHPIPILFSLARWTLGEHTRTLAEWMRDDLQELYELTTADAESLVQNDLLIPLLDGLDEVDEAKRLDCVRAINTYQSNRSLGRFAVCCRWAEYDQLITAVGADAATVAPINVTTAVRVERLSREDVQRETARPGLERVQAILKSDPVLQSFVDTPLWLHILYLGSLANPMSLDAASPRDLLYDNYVSHILTRRSNAAREKHTEPQKLLRWLGWLAVQMQKRHQTQFVLESLNFSWVASDNRRSAPAALPMPAVTKKRRIPLRQRIPFGFAVGIVAGLLGGWTFGLLVGALAAFRVEGRIDPFAGDESERLRPDSPLAAAFGRKRL